MGAKSIDLDLDTLEGAGGYAREMTEDRAARQRELLTPYIAAADALITTAAVPGRQAPMLVTREMVEQMKPGSVVVDLAAETGGNVEGSVAGEVVRIGNAQVWGGRNVPSQMPGPASKLYAQNIVNLVTLMTGEGRGRQRGVRARLRRRDRLRQLRHPRRRDRPRADPRGDRGTTATPSPPGRRRRPDVADDDAAPTARQPPTSSSICPTTRRPTSDPRHRRRLADDLHPQRLRRHRGDLQGLLDPAHPADVGRQRDPRDHPARRDHRHRHHRQHRRARRRPGRDRARRGEHGRRLRGHRPDAPDVHAQEAGEVATSESPTKGGVA